MRKKALFTLVLLALLSVNGFSQENEKRFGFELSSGVSMATKHLSESTLNPGFGF